MQYINAAAVLPECLLRELKTYVQGGYLYVPSLGRKAWGEVSGYRRELTQRNEAIRAERRQGASLEVLAQNYGLSVSGIRKVLYTK